MLGDNAETGVRAAKAKNLEISIVTKSKNHTFNHMKPKYDLGNPAGRDSWPIPAFMLADA
jgi:hypothetical protein